MAEKTSAEVVIGGKVYTLSGYESEPGDASGNSYIQFGPKCENTVKALEKIYHFGASVIHE